MRRRHSAALSEVCGKTALGKGVWGKGYGTPFCCKGWASRAGIDSRDEGVPSLGKNDVVGLP